MEEIITEMMEHVCDGLCRYSKEIEDQEELDLICADCRMGDYMCLIRKAGEIANGKS